MAATPERAREIVQQILYVTVVSVSSEGKPWNSPVFSSFDDDTDEHGNYVRDTRVELPLAALHGMVRW